jgi:membrane-bound ClpP family serine protease
MDRCHPRQRSRRAGWSARTLLHYSLLQLPALALVVIVLVFIQRWVPIPAWLFWGIIVVWIAKDAVLFPFVWRAYEASPSPVAPGLIGAVGVARERLAPRGYIRVSGSMWRAEVAGGGPPIESGQTVRVEDRHGLTLLVVPDDGSSDEESDAT